MTVFWKRSILGPLPLPRFRFHQNIVNLLVAIPPTYLEATGKNNRFPFRFQNTAPKTPFSLAECLFMLTRILY